MKHGGGGAHAPDAPLVPTPMPWSGPYSTLAILLPTNHCRLELFLTTMLSLIKVDSHWFSFLCWSQHDGLQWCKVYTSCMGQPSILQP